MRPGAGETPCSGQEDLWCQAEGGLKSPWGECGGKEPTERAGERQGRWQVSTSTPTLGASALRAAAWESLPLPLPPGVSGPVCARANASGPDGAKPGQRRDPPNLERGLYNLLPVAFPSPPNPAPLTFDLLIARLSCGLIWELPQLMSSPGSRAHMPSRWGEAFTPRGPVF